jgi:hypothetical protein
VAAEPEVVERVEEPVALEHAIVVTGPETTEPIKATTDTRRQKDEVLDRLEVSLAELHALLEGACGCVERILGCIKEMKQS